MVLVGGIRCFSFVWNFFGGWVIVKKSIVVFVFRLYCMCRVGFRILFRGFG